MPLRYFHNHIGVVLGGGSAKNVREHHVISGPMKLVSIRLPIPLIETLKAIAGHHGIAYQPMIRDLLMRFARSEFQQIHAELNSRMEEAQSTDESSPPVEAFIERTRKAASG